ncbi:hypothetical protein QWJ26_40640 [Streptomyces sp. CSDS2]|nr:hypothetical protein [Streptomyces sp. CSDS2]MDN3265977.1 hypothetical protein [Streptomyces sp. CSDS2]
MPALALVRQPVLVWLWVLVLLRVLVLVLALRRAPGWLPVPA